MARSVADIDEESIESVLVSGGEAAYDGEWHDIYEWVPAQLDDGTLSSIRFVVRDEQGAPSVRVERSPTDGYTVEQFKNELSGGTVLAQVRSKDRALMMVRDHYETTA